MSRKKTIVLSKKQSDGIKALKKWAEKYGDVVSLFGWAGSLVVMDETNRILYTKINGVVCDGGDPDDVDQRAEVYYSDGSLVI